MYALGWGLSNHPGRPPRNPLRTLVSNSGTKLRKINHFFARQARTAASRQWSENCTICERRGLLPGRRRAYFPIFTSKTVGKSCGFHLALFWRK
jgi:hypothetical protein